jgi:two-component system phosphate regulon response regulator PhoB
VVSPVAEPLRTIAILVSTPALSSILSMTLAGTPSLRVRAFESQAALTTYLHLAPVDLVVADFDSAAARADHLAEDLRNDAAVHSRDLQILALASTLTPDTKAASIHAGIDEIIMKPMSPRYLMERVAARLARRVQRQAAERRAERSTMRRMDWSGHGDNVVPLFRREAERVN